MRKSVKKGISLLLSFVMLVSFIPGSVFAADTAPVSVVYDFVPGGGTLKNNNGQSNIAKLWDVTTYINTRNWQYFDIMDKLEQMLRASEWTFDNGVYRSKTTTPSIGDTQARTLNNYGTLTFCTGANQGKAYTRDGWFALKLEAPEVPGIYSVVGHGAPSNIVDYDIWIAPYVEGENNGEFYMQDAFKVCERYTGEGANKDQNFGKIAVSGKDTEYIFVARSNGLREDAYFKLANLTLYKLSELPTEVEYSFAGGTEIASVDASTLTTYMSTKGRNWAYAAADDTVTVREAATEISAGTTATFKVKAPRAPGVYSISGVTTGSDAVSADIYVEKSAEKNSENIAVAGADLSSGAFAGSKYIPINGTEAELYVTLKLAAGEGKVSLSSIKLTKESTISESFVFDVERLEKGNPESIEYVLSGDAEYLTSFVSYESSDEDVAEVSAYGVIVPKKTGRFTITAEAGSASFEKNMQVFSESITSLPAELTAEFKTPLVERYDESEILVTDGNGNEITAANVYFTYESSDEEIIKTDDDITFTAVGIGKASVKVTVTLGKGADAPKKEIVLPVHTTGRNLLRRKAANGEGDFIDHGQFETEPRYPDENGYSPSNVYLSQSFWSIQKGGINASNLRSYEFTPERVAEESPRYPGETTNIYKLSYDWKKKEGVTGLHLIRIATGGFTHDKPENKGHAGYIEAELGKMYEFSGYFKVEDMENYKSSMTIYLNFYPDAVNGANTSSSDWAAPLVTYNSSASPAFPEGEWQKFETSTFVPDWDTLIAANEAADEPDIMWLQPRVDVITSEKTKATIEFANFEIREIAFDHVDFTMSGSFANAKTYDTFTTTATPIANNGKTIKSASGKKFNITYKSTNPRVATVDANGVITAMANGDCEIIATIEIPRVGTKSASIPVHLENMEVLLASVSSTVDGEESVTLETGNTATISNTYALTTGEPTSEEGISLYYESSDTSIAEVTQDGVITAKGPGVAVVSVYANRGKANPSDFVTVSVTDSTPLVSAALSGANETEVGIAISLRHEARHASGNLANLSECDVELKIAEGEAEDVLTIEDAENCVVRGAKVGFTKVLFVVSKDGGETVVSEPYEIEVIPSNPKSHKVNFHSRLSDRGRNVLWEANFERDGWQINKDLTAKYFQTASESTLLMYFRWVNYCIQSKVPDFGNKREADTAFDFYVDYDGWYLPIFSSPRYVNAGFTNMYMNREFIGEYDFWARVADETYYPPYPGVMNPVYLKAGEKNTFIVRTVKRGGSSWQYMTDLHLRYLGDSVAPLSELSLILSREKIAVGETAAATSEAHLSDGTQYKFGYMHGYDKPTDLCPYPSNEKSTLAFQNFESSDTSVATIDDAGNIKAVGAGTATITVTATFNGATLTASKTITVEGKAAEKIKTNVDSLALPIEASEQLTAELYLEGETTPTPDAVFAYASDNEDIASVTKDGIVSGASKGHTNIIITATFNGTTTTKTIPVEVFAEGFSKVELSAASQVIKVGSRGQNIAVKCLDENGKELDMTGAAVVFESSDENVLTVSNDGFIVPTTDKSKVGMATISATVTLGGVTRVGKLNVSVRVGKVERTLYTEDMIRTARANASIYGWARSTVNSTVKEAEGYLKNIEQYYEMLPSNGVPRSGYVGMQGDPNMNFCRYCKCNFLKKHNEYPWFIKVTERPWKVQCPECYRVFPSNDFASFYELGKNEHGEFDRDLALQRHQEKFGGTYGCGYLKNDLYPELWEDGIDPFNGEPIQYEHIKGYENGLPIIVDPETGVETQIVPGMLWGVDDGWGYDTGRKLSNGFSERHPYVALFAHNLWSYNGSGFRWKPDMNFAITKLSEAYMYTGDKKYGVAAAKLLDRVADFYPDYNLNIYCYKAEMLPAIGGAYSAPGGNSPGVILNYIWEASVLCKIFAKAYDAIFDIYEDPELIDYLTEKSIKYNYPEKLVDGKVTAEILRSRVEDRILKKIYDGVKTGRIGGNFGFKQYSLGVAAIALDDEVLSPEMIDFVMRQGATGETSCSGGDVMPTIMNNVDRDGFGHESTMGYNPGWPNHLLNLAEALNTYAKMRPENVKPEYNLLQNPKYQKMLRLFYPMIVGGNQTVNIGDYTSMATANRLGNTAYVTQNTALVAYRELRDPLFAQLLYFVNNGNVSGVNYGIFAEDPERVVDEIKADVEKYGKLDVAKSDALTGYGFMALRYGDLDYTSADKVEENYVQDYWMYYGGAALHKHHDALNLGIDYRGVEMTPEMGYPDITTDNAQLLYKEQFHAGTISHNTVVVDERYQQYIRRAADTVHFDDAGDIKLMDVDATSAYFGVTDIYRRSLVTIKLDDENSYAVDFFRVKGGNEHLYSFHAMSDKLTFSDNVNLVAQPKGSYAGVNVPYNDAAYSETHTGGYNYLDHVKRASGVGKKFSVDFKVEQLRNSGTPYGLDLHLGLTMVNDFDMTEVAEADTHFTGDRGIQSMNWLLAKRKGENLDTLFTTVIEPYEKSSSIQSIDRVEATRVDGRDIPEDEPFAAVRVTLKNGRRDYVMYASNPNREYVVTDGDVSFNFKGFAGVFTVDADGELMRVYLNDGEKLTDGESELSIEGKSAAIEGTIRGFTKELTNDHYIELESSSTVPAEDVVGQILKVDNDRIQNGSYHILSAEKTDYGYKLGTGDVTLIRRLSERTENGYEYNISEGEKARINTSYYDTTAPKIWGDREDYSVSVGGAIEIKVGAESPAGKALTFDASGLPNGAIWHEDTQTITWSPTKTQVGMNNGKIVVTDGTFKTTLDLPIMVFGATTGGSDFGGGGGGGGGTPTEPKPEEPTDEPTDPTEPNEGEGEGAGAEEVKGFRDLGNHAWAEDSINALAEEGIIKGTSETTFAPSSNITRADYAILLVRAFELTSENTENFADVAESDYFAGELAIARNTGLVGGIGDNKFAPRKSITREDMMVIVYRALVKLGVELKSEEVEFADYENVSEYAKEAVKSLISSGLVNGKNGRIDPKANTTRAEVAVLLKRILDYIK